MSPSVDLRSAIVKVLNEHGQISADADLSCYCSDGLFCVDYIYTKETAELLQFTDTEKRLLKDEEELIEYFENPEEAADFYLRLTSGKLLAPPPKKVSDRTDAREKAHEFEMLALNKESYF